MNGGLDQCLRNSAGTAVPELIAGTRGGGTVYEYAELSRCDSAIRPGFRSRKDAFDRRPSTRIRSQRPVIDSARITEEGIRDA